MKYLLMIAAERVLERMDPDSARPHLEEYRAFTAEVQRNGHLVGCHRLQPPAAAVTVRVRAGQVSITDGPYAETKEQIGGYYLIEARDMNEAIQIASRIPGARTGCVEVRPIATDEATAAALGSA